VTILGIDPGTTRIGFGVIEKKGNSYSPLAYGLIEPESAHSIPERLEIIHHQLNQLIKKFNPDLFSVEGLFFFKNVKTVISVAQARGVILLAAQKAGIPIFEPTPLQVKQGITGYGRADKNQIANMVVRLLNLKQIPKPDDITDALAIAITGANYWRPMP
jgi:crossover junction endodeoxyribonuclease RuvC